MKYTELPLRLERIMLKLLDGAILGRHTQHRIEAFLVCVDAALKDANNPLTAQRIWRSISRMMERFDDDELF